MFSPFARDLLRSPLSNRIDNLMKPTAPLDDPWDGDYPKFNIFGNKFRSLESGKRSNTFQLFLNATQFQPRDISIKIEDGFIVIHAQHDVKPDMHGYVCREFTRRCKIPDNIDSSTLNATFNKNGLLLIKANTKPADSTPDGEVTIPIEIQGPLTDDGDFHEKRKSLEKFEIEIPISSGIC